MGTLHLCIDFSGLYAVAGCSKLSPRIKLDKLSCKICPSTHACVFNMSIGFWCSGTVGGCVCVFTFLKLSLYDRDYVSGLRVLPDSRVVASGFFRGNATRRVRDKIGSVCRHLRDSCVCGLHV